MKKIAVVFLYNLFIISNLFAIDQPTLYSPSNATNLENSVRVELVWNRMTVATGYEIEIDTASSFDSPVYSLYDSFTYSSTGKPYKVIEPLLYGTTYYWRVRATNDIDTSDWSQVRRFTTSACPDWYSPNTASELENSAYASLQWYEIKGTTDYEVEIDTVNTFDSPLYSMYDSFSYHATSQLPCVNVSPLLFGTTYYWRVRAINAIDTSQWSQICRFTTSACPALYSPSNGATLSNAASVTLQWYTVSGASGYLVELDTTSSFNSPVLLSDTYTPSNYNSIANKGINNLFFGKTYYWRVRAVCDALNDTSAYSPVRTFTTAAYPALYSPSNGATLSNAASVTLQWYTVSGASGYLVELDTTSSFNSPVLLSDTYTPPNNNSIANKGINNLFFGKTYYWRVRAVCDALNDTSAYSPVRTFTTAAYPALYRPSNNTTLSNTASVTLQWYTVSGTSGYLVELDTTSSFNSPVLLSDTYTLTNNNTIANKGIDNLLSGTTYYWRVRTLSPIDTSAWSYVWRFTTAYQLTTAPTLVSPANGSTEIAPSGVELVWNELDNVTGYRYQVATDNAFASIVRSGTTAETNATCNLMYGATYYWRVQGYNASGNSVWSAVWNFSTQDCQQPTGETSATACSSYLWHGTTYTESGNYTITVPQSNGCDSVLTLHLTINQPLAELVEATACDSYEWDGETYTESGTYEKTFTASNGCDSVVTLHLTINQPLAEQVEATACSSYEWNGETYTESGTYDKTFTASNGCDSVVTLHLTVNESPTRDFSAVACGSYVWNNQTYTESGNYEQNIASDSGCDSIIACDSYEWNGETYTESGTYEKTFTASNGCDSVVTLHLTISHPLAEHIEATACDSYEWNGETYTESGTYEKTFTASNGCDSIVTLHLTVNHPPLVIPTSGMARLTPKAAHTKRLSPLQTVAIRLLHCN